MTFQTFYDLKNSVHAYKFCIIKSFVKSYCTSKCLIPLILLRRTEITGQVTEPKVTNFRVGIEPRTGPRASHTLLMCVLKPIPDKVKIVSIYS